MDDLDSWFFSALARALAKSGKSDYLKESPDVTRKVIGKFLTEAAHTLLRTIKSQGFETLSKNRECARGFEERLMEEWKKPIDLIEMLLGISFEVGAEFNRKHRGEASESNDFLFDVLTRQHARCCLIGNEILVLLKSGFADGAMARWRTLHEIVVVSYFIQKHGQDMAKRFLDYATIETYKEAQLYQKYCQRLGYEPLKVEEMLRIERMVETIRSTCEKGFDKEYGWIPLENLAKRNFAEIEKSVKFDHLRPYYKLACDNVHSGPKGIGFRLGLVLNGIENPILLAGPSDYGLADPGQCMAISLHQMTTLLLSTKPNMKRLIGLKVMEMLVGEICSAFVEVQSEIKTKYRYKYKT
jgi:hypothetical protein